MDNPLVQPDPGLYIWTIATFLVLLFLLHRFAWKPLLGILAEREDTIRKSLDDAEKTKVELERLQRESKEIIVEARVEAQSIITESRSQAEKVKGEVIQEAKIQAHSILQATEKKIQSEKDQAVSEIRDEVVNLSLMMASKLIKQNLTEETNKALIEESLQKIESSGIAD